MPRSIRQFVADLPAVLWLRRARYVRGLRRGLGRGLFWGVYSSFSEAAEAARTHPSRLALGYDHAAVAALGREYYEQLYLRDYPALLWILRFLSTQSDPWQRSTATVVDLGGHLGEQFRVFRRYWQPGPDPRWIVLDTKAMVEHSQTLSESDRPPALSFTADRACIGGASLLFASGSLQYLDRDLWDLLDDTVNPPAHLVLNKVPLSGQREMWTTQNAEGQAIVPYHVWNRERFIGALASRGYRVLDEWRVPDRKVTIPFHRDLGTSANSGVVLSREQPR